MCEQSTVIEYHIVVVSSMNISSKLGRRVAGDHVMKGEEHRRTNTISHLDSASTRLASDN